MAIVQDVYLFVQGYSDGNKDMKTLLGGKGANLCEMARLGLPVPPGKMAVLEAFLKADIYVKPTPLSS